MDKNQDYNNLKNQITVSKKNDEYTFTLVDVNGIMYYSGILYSEVLPSWVTGEAYIDGINRTSYKTNDQSTKGYGKVVILYMIETAKKLGADIVTLKVDNGLGFGGFHKNNLYNFYKSIGFKNLNSNNPDYEGSMYLDIRGYSIPLNEEINISKQTEKNLTIKYNKSLNKEFWVNNILKKSVRKKLNELAKFYYKSLKIDAEIIDIIFTGSLANYNYTEFSDIDLHIIIDYKDVNKDKEFVGNFFGEKRKTWVESNNIRINGYPVEIYVQDIDQLDENGMGAIYSIKTNEWIKKPKYELPEIDKEKIIKNVNMYLTKLKKIDSMTDLNKKLDSIYKIMYDIKIKREKAADNEGEFAVDNLVFKILRNRKILDKIKELKEDTINLLFSLK